MKKKTAIKEMEKFYREFRDTKQELDERRKNFNACVAVILDPSPFSEDLKRIFTEMCHYPVEQLLYEAIIKGVTQEEAKEEDDFKSMVEKGAKLYFLHNRFNWKLERGIYALANKKDEYLLNCIVNEIKERKPSAEDMILSYFNIKNPIQEDVELAFQMFRDYIYRRYEEIDFSVYGQTMQIKDKGKEYTDFDSYIKYLFDLKHSADTGKYSFNRIWSMTTGHSRSTGTFECKRPSKNELYLFCLGGAYDYEHFCRMKSLLLKEIEEKKPIKGESSIRTAKRREELEHDSDRDKILNEFLKKINARLRNAREDVNYIEDLVPARMIQNANYDLENLNFKPLRKKMSKKQILPESDRVL